jgi:hypothetical protein
MTLDELKEIVNQAVNEKMRVWPRPITTRSLQEIMDSIDHHRWTPPPGAKSTLELLREDRER